MRAKVMLRCFLLAYALTNAAFAVATAGTQGVQTWRDGRGQVVTLATTPTRIVSSSLASDEILLEILTRARRVQDLVALSTLADEIAYSNIVTEAQAIKDRVGRNLESTLALRPDLVVLASFNRPEILTRLAAPGRAAFVLADFSNIDDIVRSIRTLGQLVFAAKEGEALANEVERQIAMIKKQAQQLPRRPSILGFYEDGSISGRNTLFDDLVRLAGGHNVAADLKLDGWPKITAETLATLNPDLLVTGGDTQDKKRVLERLRQTPGWKSLRAVKNERLLLIADRQLSATSQHVLKALSALQQEIKKIAAGPTLDRQEL